MKSLSTTTRKEAKAKTAIGLLCLFCLAMPVASAYAQDFHFTITSDQRGGTNAVPPYYSRTLQAINNIVGGPVLSTFCAEILIMPLRIRRIAN